MYAELQQRSSSSHSNSYRRNSTTSSPFEASPFSPMQRQAKKAGQTQSNSSYSTEVVPAQRRESKVHSQKSQTVLNHNVNETRLPEQSIVGTEVQTPKKAKQQQVQQPQQPQVTPNFSRPNAYKQQQVQQPQQPQVTPNFSRPNAYKQQQVQQPQQPRPPIRPPQKEAELLLKMDYTAREQAIRDLRQQRRSDYVDLIIEKLEELDRQQAVIRGLKERIPSQAPQQEQPSETRTEGIKKRRGKPFDATKDSRQKVAEGMRHYETYSDQTKLLGQDSTHTNIDRIGAQNLPANQKDPMTALHNLPDGTPEQFGNDAAVIGETRDEIRAAGGLLIFSDSLNKFKDGLSNKKKPRRERIANASGGLGEMTSAVTYTTIVGTQAASAVSHHINQQGTTAASGAIAGAKQGGRIAGTLIPTDAGKAAAGILTTVPKLINYTDAAVKASKRENFGGHKSIGRGVKNVADLTRAAAGAVKDTAGLAQSSGEVGAEATKLIAGGAVAPGANMALGSAEVIQGGYKLHKGYKNSKGLDEIETEDTGTLDQLKQIQEKKMKRAAINATLGSATVAGGIAAVAGGPPGLIAGTGVGAAVGGFQVGQWGARKFKQKMRDKGVKGFDNTKSTERKNEDRSQLAKNTLTMLERPLGDKAKETILFSIGLNDSKKDSAVQQVYNEVLAQYLGAEELQQPTTTINQILKLKGEKNNLKQEVSWDKLSHKDFPAAFREGVKKAAIDKALKAR